MCTINTIQYFVLLNIMEVRIRKETSCKSEIEPFVVTVRPWWFVHSWPPNSQFPSFSARNSVQSWELVLLALLVFSSAWPSRPNWSKQCGELPYNRPLRLTSQLLKSSNWEKYDVSSLFFILIYLLNMNVHLIDIFK